MIIEIQTIFDGKLRVCQIEEQDWFLLKEYQDIIDSLDLKSNEAEELVKQRKAIDRCSYISQTLQKKGFSKHDFRTRWSAPQYDRYIKIKNILE